MSKSRNKINKKLFSEFEEGLDITIDKLLVNQDFEKIASELVNENKHQLKIIDKEELLRNSLTLYQKQRILKHLFYHFISEIIIKNPYIFDDLEISKKNFIKQSTTKSVKIPELINQILSSVKHKLLLEHKKRNLKVSDEKEIKLFINAMAIRKRKEKEFIKYTYESALFDANKHLKLVPEIYFSNNDLKKLLLR